MGLWYVVRHPDRVPLSLLNTLFIRSALERMVLPHITSNQEAPDQGSSQCQEYRASRLLLVRRVTFEGWIYAAAAEGFGVSIRTVAWQASQGDGRDARKSRGR
jgi:hypothetical protein